MTEVIDDIRKLVTVETVVAIKPIEGADNIEAATVRGWDVVVKKGDFVPGSHVLYFEIDSALPVSDPRFEFLASRATKTVNDVTCHVLKTIRLRGQYSQGLVLPIHEFLDELEEPDIAEALGIVKYEKPLPANMAGNIKGNFPVTYARKTDSERVQNLGEYWPTISEYSWIPTEKVDGTSCTLVKTGDGEIIVASRNYILEEGDNVYWDAVRKFNLAELLDDNSVLQFEIYGEGVQKNPLGLTGIHIAVFNYRLHGEDFPRHEWPEWLDEHAAPVYDLTFPATPAEALEQVDGIKSLINPKRLAEGVVWTEATATGLKCLGDRSTWKAISNKYIMKHDA